MIKVASLNCRGLNKKLKRKSIFNLCSNYTISCLQETYINDQKRNLWELDWKGSFYHVNGTSNSNGLIILIDSKIEKENIKVVLKKDRVLCLKITISDSIFFVANVYAPCSKKDKLSFLMIYITYLILLIIMRML